VDDVVSSIRLTPWLYDNEKTSTMTDRLDIKARQLPARRRIGYAVGLVLFIIYLWFLVLSFFLTGGFLLNLLRDHYVFFVGLPFAALIAFVMVSTFEITRGDIEFEIAGLRLKGASGPLIIWVLVYLALVVSISLAWPLN
jgi:hypothetical protein